MNASCPLRARSESSWPSSSPERYSASADSGSMARATGVVVSGHGFGHGIGLSQRGAEQRAAAGQDFRQILAFYYPGAALERARGRTIRVLLAEVPTAQVGSAAPFS